MSASRHIVAFLLVASMLLIAPFGLAKGAKGAGAEDLDAILGRPAGLSGVALDRPEQLPLIAQLLKAGAELTRLREHRSALVGGEARLREDAAQLRDQSQLLQSNAAAERRDYDAIGVELSDLATPTEAARHAMVAVALDAYVRQDVDVVLQPAKGFDSRRTRRLYAEGAINVAWAELDRLNMRRGILEARSVAAADAERAASDAAAQRDGKALIAEQTAALQSNRGNEITDRITQLETEVEALWSGMEEIGRRPMSTTTSAAASLTPSAPAVTSSQADLTRFTANALASAPLGPQVSFKSFDFAESVLSAYVLAAERMARDRPACHLRWELLAGIGRIESYHGRIFGNKVDTAGNVRPGIRGPALDGISYALILDTDGGRYDGDSRYDRAVGPMQFIPGSWRIYGRDADGNGVADPHNYFDAAVGAAEHLCRNGVDTATGAGLFKAVFGYNASTAYVADVLGYMAGYGKLGLPAAFVAVAPVQAGAPPEITFGQEPTTSTATSTATSRTTTASGSSTSSSSTSSSSTTSSSTSGPPRSSSTTSTSVDTPTTTALGGNASTGSSR